MKYTINNSWISGDCLDEICIDTYLSCLCGELGTQLKHDHPDWEVDFVTYGTFQDVPEEIKEWIDSQWNGDPNDVQQRAWDRSKYCALSSTGRMMTMEEVVTDLQKSGLIGPI